MSTEPGNNEEYCFYVTMRRSCRITKRVIATTAEEAERFIRQGRGQQLGIPVPVTEAAAIIESTMRGEKASNFPPGLYKDNS